MQGTLRDFRLAEILQLVAVQQKTGLLRVQSHDELLTFYFDHGILVSCRDRRRLATDPLLGYLLRTGFLDETVYSSLESELEETRQDLVQLLLDRCILTQEDIDIALDDLAQELVHRTYPWCEGTYRFISGEEVLQGLSHTISRQVEGLLMEAARRSDEWPRLLEKLPGEDVLVEALRGSTEGLDERTRSLLDKLDKPLRMGELVAQAKMPEYDVYEIVAAALEAGMTRVLEVPKKTVEPPQADAKDSLRPPVFKPRRQVPHVLFWIVSIWGFLSIVWGAHLLSTRIDHSSTEELAARLATERARVEVQHQLEVYRALHGRFPASVEQLASSDLLSFDRLQEARIKRYSASLDGTRYRLALAHLEP